MKWINKKRSYKLAGLCSLIAGLLVLSASHALYVSEACVDDERPEIQRQGYCVVNLLDGVGLVCVLSSIVLFVAGSMGAHVVRPHGRHKCAACLMACFVALGCAHDVKTSQDDVKELADMLEPYKVVVTSRSLEEHEMAGNEISLLVSKLEAFCKCRKIARSAVINAMEERPILNDDDYLVYVFRRYSCSIVGIMFEFNGGACLFDAME